MTGREVKNVVQGSSEISLIFERVRAIQIQRLTKLVPLNHLFCLALGQSRYLPIYQSSLYYVLATLKHNFIKNKNKTKNNKTTTTMKKVFVKIQFSMHTHVEFYKGEMEGKKAVLFYMYVLHLAYLSILLQFKKGLLQHLVKQFLVK